MFRCIVLLCTFLLCSCAAVNQVSVSGGLGDELRSKDNRESISVGVDTKLVNGISVSTKYRYRTSDFEFDAKNEHGFFIGVKVPIWKNPNK